MSHPLDLLRARLLEAAGLGSAAVLAAALVAACDPQHTQAADDDDDERPWGSIDDTGGGGTTGGEGPWTVAGEAEVCAAAPMLTPESNDENPYLWGTYTVCTWPDEDGGCEAGHDLDAQAAVIAIIGEHPESDWCNYQAHVMCGPDPGFEGACCYETEVYDDCYDEGRPFTVAGEARQAPAVVRGDWCSPVEAEGDGVSAEARAATRDLWLRAARAEHASIASFARFALELLALGAPPELVADATRAMADELRHARQCFGVVAALGGEAAGPGALPVAGALDEEPVLARVLAATIREGCVNETLAAAEARAAAARCADPAIREVLEGIARDEEAHAALAWRAVRWMLRQDPGLVERVHAVIAEERPRGRLPESGPHDAELAALGRLGARERAALGQLAFARVVVPCAEALLAEVSSASEPQSRVQPSPS